MIERMVRDTTLLMVMLPAAVTASAQERLVDDCESLDGWKSGGQKEIRVDLSDRHVKQGRFAFHFHIEVDHTSEFERYANMYLDLFHHFNSMPVPYFFDRESFLGAKKGTPEYLARITEAYRVAAEYLDRKGWLDGSYVYCIDEVVVHRHTREVDLKLLNQVFEAIHVAHPKIRIFGAETPSPVLRGMDIWCMNINSFDEDVLDEQHSLGNQSRNEPTSDTGDIRNTADE